MKITQRDYIDAARFLQCEPEAVEAVAQVEAPKGGFLPDGRPTILFEAKAFSRFTNNLYDLTHPNISSKVWDKNLYRDAEGEYKRFGEAATLNFDAALKSCSWGRFQIMGFNFRECGFTSVRDFVHEMQKGEKEQMFAFIAFLKHNKLDVLLKNKEWEEFAKRYNGPGYKKNNYDEKLKKAYLKLKNGK